MKLIINASTLYGTGVSQVAISFLEECIKYKDNTYVVFLSKHLASILDFSIFPPTFSFYIFSDKLYNPIHWYSHIKMKRIENLFNPDCVFSLFGPSWWHPKSPHLQGYAYPHYVYPDSPIWDILSAKEKFKWYIFKKIHKFALLHSGSFFVCETADVSKRLAYYLNIPESNISTVSNTANSYFLNYNRTENSKKEHREYRFFTLCSPYVHKNLGILNSVIPILDNKNIDVVFYVTLKKEDFNSIFIPAVRHRIINVGILKPQDCPSVADDCDALFLPTLLECFSASYPEAMILHKPIITSNLSFARDICGNSALYFDPLNANSVTKTIEELIGDKILQQNLIRNGIKRVSGFYSPSERANAYLEICKKIIQKNDS